MTPTQRDALRDRLTTALVSAIITSLVPVAFAILSGLWSAPRRLELVELQLRRGAVQDSTQTSVLQAMGENIELLTLMRCMERPIREADPELYARLGCSAVRSGRR